MIDRRSIENDQETDCTGSPPDEGAHQGSTTGTAKSALTAYSTKIRVIDLLGISWAVGAAQLIRFGAQNSTLATGNDQTPYALVSLALIVVWWAVLEIWGSRDERVLGHGPDEYKRVVTCTMWLFAGIAISSYLLQLETARGYVGVALPLGLIAILVGRWSIRNLLIAARLRGDRLRRVLLIGTPESAAHLHEELAGHLEAGYLPVGAYVPPSAEIDVITSRKGDLRVLGTGWDIEHVISIIHNERIEAVAITTGSALTPYLLRQLSWELAARNIGMIVAPALTDVAGPRISTQLLPGLPLIHVRTPKLEGVQAATKRAFDITAALLICIVLLLPMALVALVIRIDSRGPALFHQIRVGRGGRTFKMLKFRSMVRDAESMLTALIHRNEGAGVLFKMKHDPRVTRVGRALRRYSVDEVPQLFNVLRGDMSLVGPRPPLPSEVEKYDYSASRRLLVKPGITGLWQISGRSDLSWEDSLRLDLYYVENWSLTQDLLILFKTARAVLTRQGAY